MYTRYDSTCIVDRDGHDFDFKSLLFELSTKSYNEFILFY